MEVDRVVSSHRCICFHKRFSTDFHRIEDLQLPEIHPKMAFITGALDKEIRLSFAQRIKGTLPEPYQPLITEGKEQDTPDFKYTLESKFTLTINREEES